ncbi:MAG: cistern family PEP-CTERM protein [Pseudomonadota bacterium]
MKIANFSRIAATIVLSFASISSHAFVFTNTGTTAGNPASPVFTVQISLADIGQSFTVNYAGSGASSALAATSVYTVNSLSPGLLNLSQTLTNQTSAALQAAIVSYGFSVIPNATDLTLLNTPAIFTSAFVNPAPLQAFPGGFQQIDICGAPAGVTSCEGGPIGSGLQSGNQSDTINLLIAGAFSPALGALPSVTLDAFPIRFATSFGTFELAGTPVARVPETASGALLGIGMLGLALGRRRRAKSASI